jgi:regulator of protease activity HflC (stomatin/prohibitin superfamily)
MTKVKLLGTLLLLAFSISCSKVPAGYVGVKVHLLGDSKGVDNEILGVGRYWIGVNEELYVFPTFKVTKVWTRDKQEDSPANEEMVFQTKEGLVVTADVGLTYSVEPDKVAVLFKTYRNGIEEITHVYIRGFIRDALTQIASEYEVTEAYGPKKNEIITRAEKLVRAELEPKGITVDKLYWVGAIRLPEKVQQALDSKIEATQKALQRENEVAQARAEADKKIAEARGDAEALRLKAATLTTQNLEWERLQIQKMAIEKWKGEVPATMVPGASIPFLGVK